MGIGLLLGSFVILGLLIGFMPLLIFAACALVAAFAITWLIFGVTGGLFSTVLLVIVVTVTLLHLGRLLRRSWMLAGANRSGSRITPQL